MDGAITDGSSLVILRMFPKLPFNLTYNLSIDPDLPHVIGTPLLLGSLSPTSQPVPELPLDAANENGGNLSIDSNGDGLAYYRPPLNFRLLNGDPNKEAKDIYIHTLSNNGGELNDLFTEPFTLRRPPIVLVHGLLGSKSTWENDQWKDEQAPFATLQRSVDYSDTNIDGFAENFAKIPKTIQDVLGDLRTGKANAKDEWNKGKKFAATRVDVVAHSLGGLLTKWFVADLGAAQLVARGGSYSNFTTAKAPDTNYLRDNNFGGGDIRRFVSLDSPYQGSPLATQLAPLVDPIKVSAWLNNDANKVKSYYEKVKHIFYKNGDISGTFKYPNAAKDLSFASPALQLLSTAVYPIGRKAVLWRPMVGIADNPAAGDTISDDIFSFLFQIVPNVFSPLDALNPADSDLIVSTTSQRNGVDFSDSEKEKFEFHRHIHTGNVAGFKGAPQSDEMAARVRGLLTADPAADDFRVLDK